MNRTKNLLAVLFVAAAFALLFLSVRRSKVADQSSPGLIAVGAAKTAIDFTLPDAATGRPMHLQAAAKSGPLVLDFWATWCQPCLAEMPHLQKLYDQYKSKDFVVVAVSMDGPESIADVPSFAKRNQMSFPVLLDEDSRIASIYNPRKSAPLSVIIDKSGRVVVTREGYNAGDEEHVAEDVKKVIDSSDATTK